VLKVARNSSKIFELSPSGVKKELVAILVNRGLMEEMCLIAPGNGLEKEDRKISRLDIGRVSSSDAEKV
jgi:hypothetical protein